MTWSCSRSLRALSASASSVIFCLFRRPFASCSSLSASCLHTHAQTVALTQMSSESNNFTQIRYAADLLTRLRRIRTYCSLRKPLIHHSSLSVCCRAEVNICTLNSYFLMSVVCIILYNEGDRDMSSNLVFSICRHL